MHPTIIALLVTSALISLLLLYCSGIGLQILLRWSLNSGSELQLRLERKTYLVTTILFNVMIFQLASLFLFVFTADRLHPLFIGAMCAAGTLNANPFGYPTLLLKIATFFLAGLWLVLNHADTRAYDYPLTRTKYSLLLLLTPVVLAETSFLALYILGLKPDLIISCCGSLFGAEGQGLASELAALPVGPVRLALVIAMVLTLATGLWFLLRGRQGWLFAMAGTASFPVALAAIISFISLYYYELPTHHCPFDILQAGYGYVGYPVYLALLGGAISAAGVGVLSPFSRKPSLARSLPRVQRRLAVTSLVLFVIFAALVGWELATSKLILID
nr:hypothetical protein [Desulfuromonas versatilis]